MRKLEIGVGGARKAAAEFLKTARALDLKAPQSVFLRADRVIE